MFSKIQKALPNKNWKTQLAFSPGSTKPIKPKHDSDKTMQDMPKADAEMTPKRMLEKVPERKGKAKKKTEKGSKKSIGKQPVKSS